MIIIIINPPACPKITISKSTDTIFDGDYVLVSSETCNERNAWRQHIPEGYTVDQVRRYYLYLYWYKSETENHGWVISDEICSSYG